MLMLMLKLNRQYFGYLMQRADSLEKTLMLAKIEGPIVSFLTALHFVVSGLSVLTPIFSCSLAL